MPKISVIMPAYNAEKYIAQALESILCQTFRDFELIVINDCSKDATESIILSYGDERIVYVKNEKNLGVAETLNKGLALAKGEYIARMDADDIAMGSRFQKQVEYLDSHPDCGICGSNLILFGEAQPETPFTFAQEDEDIRGDMLFNSSFAHPSVMLRSQVLRSHGLRYDTAYERVEDYHLWHRLLQVSKGHNLQMPLLRYRMHPGQVTQAHRQEQLQVLAKLRRQMLSDWGVTFTQEELAVFVRVCQGERVLTEEEYGHFLSGGRKLLARCPGKKQAKRTYAALNMNIKAQSGIQSREIFSLKEPAYALYSRLRQIGKK